MTKLSLALSNLQTSIIEIEYALQALIEDPKIIDTKTKEPVAGTLKRAIKNNKIAVKTIKSYEKDIDKSFHILTDSSFADEGNHT